MHVRQKEVIGQPKLSNMISSKGGKVHKIVLMDPYSYKIIPDDLKRNPGYGHPGRVCEPGHNPLKSDPIAWFHWWDKTDELITCKSCLKKYWPTGRKRV